MGLSLANLRTRFYRATGTVQADWPSGSDIDCDQYLNTSWWEVADEFDFREKEAGFNFNLTAGTNEYDIPTKLGTSTFDAVQSVAIQDLVTLNFSELLLMSLQYYESNVSGDTSLRAKPEKYIRRSSKITFWPIPDDAYLVQIYYLQTLADIVSSGPPIPQSWHESILFGAIWRGFADLGDVDKVSLFKRLYADSINSKTPVKAKELSDTKLAGISIPGRDYP